MHNDLRQHLRHNFIVNVMDGGFFGIALGVASFITVIPLFVATLTDNTAIIGLVSTLHLAGWQLPQLLTAQRVARLPRYKPMVLLMTIQERLPFLLLALVALLIPTIGREAALILTLILLTWQGIGGGLSATPWQSMVAKIMPLDMRGTFYGSQSSAAATFSTGGALLAGIILGGLSQPFNYALCFFIAFIGMMVSYGFLAWTREPAVPPSEEHRHPPTTAAFVARLGLILKQDVNFRWFILARIFAQIAAVGAAFYTIYATRRFEMSEELAGVMTAVLMIAQIVANVGLGWLGDRWGHRATLALGILLTGIAAGVAMFAPSINWFYLVFALAGVATATLWTNINTLTSEFGVPAERPYYIALANTCAAPATLLTPILGGWLADAAGFGATFTLGIVASLLTVTVLTLFVRDPHYAPPAAAPLATAHAAGD
ncbi:MAG: MFS transporter [Chloroflexota bacterium]|nr:MFS transporter [Chloroflexota bacterium]